MNCNHNTYTRSDAVVGVGFEIEHAGKRMHSIAWPDKPAERMMDDEMERKNVVCKQAKILNPNTKQGDVELESIETEETATDEVTTLDESPSPKSEAETIREYLAEHPDADNATVIEALGAMKIEVNASQVSRQRKNLAKAD